MLLYKLALVLLEDWLLALVFTGVEPTASTHGRPANGQIPTETAFLSGLSGSDHYHRERAPYPAVAPCALCTFYVAFASWVK